MQNVHPWFVHFPIALLAVGVLFDFLGFVWKKESFSHAGWWCNVFGVAAVIATIITGFQAYFTVPHPSETAHKMMQTHRNVQVFVGTLFTGLLIWRTLAKKYIPTKGAPIYFVIAATAVGFMLYGAHLGGQLVYQYGVGTTLSPAAESGAHGHEQGSSSESESQSHDHNTGSEHSH